jgi:hypothetical protein
MAMLLPRCSKKSITVDYQTGETATSKIQTERELAGPIASLAGGLGGLQDTER